VKQVIVVNEELNLPRGKLAAQVAHASVASLVASEAEQQQNWFNVGMPKIVLAGENLSQLQVLYEKCQELKIPAYLVQDAGKTVVEAGTVTCLGIGPATPEEIDKITGSLKLLK